MVALAAAAYYFFYRQSIPQAPGITAEAPTTNTTARFTTIEGNVKVKTVGTFEWLSANSSMTLKKGDLVRTAASSAAEVTFFDGTVVHVRPDSLITIEETSEDPRSKRRRVAWHISSGEVNFKTVRPNVPGSQTEISTPTVKTTTTEDAAGGIKVQETGETEVKVSQGTTQLTTKSGETRALSSGKAIRVDVAGKAGPELVLPGVPTLLAPPHQSEVAYPDPARSSTVLAWKSVPNAVAYHLMLDYSAYFNRPLVDRTGIKDSSQEVRGLEVGKYYWRVAAVDKDGVEGPFAEFYRFSVTKPAGSAVGAGPPPSLSIDSVDVRTNILQVKGRTEPGATVTVNGQRVDVMADGTFNEFITLEKPGRQVVIIRATSINGGVNEQRKTVVVVGD